MTVGAFIVDDEAPARRELRYLLEQVPEVAILGEACNPSQALQGIREKRPQLVFLDIQLPGLNGIELAQVIGEFAEPPLIVFATAFQQFAVDAFSVDAFDYILKPFTFERVKKTVAKAVHAVGPERRPLPEQSGIKRVLVQKRGKQIPVAPESIVFICAEEGEAQVHTRDGIFSSKSTVSALEELLAPYAFVRVHRNSLVNLNCIIEIIPWFSGSCKLVLNDAPRSQVLVSRYHAKELKQALLLNK